MPLFHRFFSGIIKCVQQTPPHSCHIPWALALQHTYLFPTVTSKAPYWGLSWNLQKVAHCYKNFPGPRDRRKRLTTPELYKGFIKGTYRQKQRFWWPQDNRSPYPKGDEACCILYTTDMC